MKKKKTAKASLFTPYQKFVVVLLALLQFTVILDFMIISPLGAILIPKLQITPEEFGFVVSVYAFSAGLSGLLSAGFADLYDRKKFLLFFYSGFIVATLFCGLAPSYPFLLVARTFTGIFGGVIGSIVAAIATDLFPFQIRGRVMGFVQTAFAASQILGLPLGLFLSNLWGWHAPFVMIVLFAAMVMGLIWVYLKPIDHHLRLQSKQSAFVHFRKTLLNPKYLFAFLATGLLSVGGFMLMPFSSDYTVHNLGIPLTELPFIYLITGMSMMFIGPLVGRASDFFGKYNVFVFGSILTIGMVLFYTHLGVTPLPELVVINTCLFIGIFSRMIPSQALMSAIPDEASRGSFMAIGASIQQISGGVASLIAGLIVIEGEGGNLLHFDELGYAMTATVSITVVMMYFIHRRIKEKVGFR